jgi:hypothetical protein
MSDATRLHAWVHAPAPSIQTALLATSEDDRDERRLNLLGDPLSDALQVVRDMSAARDAAWRLACASHMDVLTPLVRPAAARAWATHLHLRDVPPHSLDEPKEEDEEQGWTLIKLVLCSWRTALAFLLLLDVVESSREHDQGVYQRTPLRLLDAADAFVYPAVVAARVFIAVSAATVSSYTLNTWENAVFTFLDAYDATGWTPGADEYFHALVMRWAQLVLSDHEDEPDSAYDNRTACDLSTPQRLRDRFVLLQERRLVAPMRHCASARVWYAAGRERTPRNVPRQQLLDAWVAFVAGQEELEQRVHENVLRRFMRPGDLDEAAFAHLDEDGDNDMDGILDKMRADVFATLRAIHATGVTALITAWADSARAAAHLDPVDADSWEHVACMRPALEHVALLIFETALDLWFASHQHLTWRFRAHAFIDDQSQASAEVRRPPVSPAAMHKSLGAGQTPGFVAISRLYGMVDAEKSALVTPHLVDALTAWLIASVQEERLGMADVPPELRAICAL